MVLRKDLPNLEAKIITYTLQAFWRWKQGSGETWHMSYQTAGLQHQESNQARKNIKQK